MNRDEIIRKAEYPLEIIPGVSLDDINEYSKELLMLQAQEIFKDIEKEARGLRPKAECQSVKHQERNRNEERGKACLIVKKKWCVE